jgi:hypothetical protein
MVRAWPAWTRAHLARAHPPSARRPVAAAAHLPPPAPAVSHKEASVGCHSSTRAGPEVARQGSSRRVPSADPAGGGVSAALPLRHTPKNYPTASAPRWRPMHPHARAQASDWHRTRRAWLTPAHPWSAAAAAAPPGRGRCVSRFLDKNRRCVGKSQSTRPPTRTPRPPHRPALLAHALQIALHLRPGSEHTHDLSGWPPARCEGPRGWTQAREVPSPPQYTNSPHTHAYVEGNGRHTCSRLVSVGGGSRMGSSTEPTNRAIGRGTCGHTRATRRRRCLVRQQRG